MDVRNDDVPRHPAAMLMDTPREQAFDRITNLAARLLRVPIAMVSVVDNRRNFFKSIVGLPAVLEGATEVPLSHSYCRHVIDRGTMLAVEDTIGHAVVGDNPTNVDFGIRAYLGMPVFAGDGQTACSLCVLDAAPRRWSEEEIQILRDLKEILETELALREEVDRRRLAEEHKGLLLREMEHRVKNTLSTVQALVSMSLKGAQDLDDLRESLPERISALGKTQAFLNDSGPTGVGLRALVAGELGPYAAEGNVSLAIDDIQIASRDGLLVGMIIHELATNAAKYGAIAKHGRLMVKIGHVRDAAGLLLALDWSEEGVGPPALPPRAGFGTTLLQTLIVRQYQGRLDRELTPDGLRVSAEFRVEPA